MERTKIAICMGSSCFSRGNRTNLGVIQEWMESNKANDRFELTGRLCCEQCSKGPIIEINDKAIKVESIEHLHQLLEKNYD